MLIGLDSSNEENVVFFEAGLKQKEQEKSIIY